MSDDNTDREALAKVIDEDAWIRQQALATADRVLAVLPSLGWVKAEPEMPYVPGDAGAEYYAQMRKLWGNDKRLMLIVDEAERDYERRYPRSSDTTKEPTP